MTDSTPPGPPYPQNPQPYQPQPYQPHPGSPQSVPTYLVPAILATLFCCQVFGIVAIVYAAQVDGRVRAGDMRGAWEMSNKAKSWCWLSFWSVFVIWVLYLLIFMGGAAM